MTNPISNIIHDFLVTTQNLSTEIDSLNFVLTPDTIVQKMAFLEEVQQNLQSKLIEPLSPNEEQELSQGQELWKRVYQTCLRNHLNQLFQESTQLTIHNAFVPLELIYSLEHLQTNPYLTDKEKEMIQINLNDLLKLQIQTKDFGTLEALPFEILTPILSLLSIEDFRSCLRVNKTVNQFLKSPLCTKILENYQKRLSLYKTLKNHSTELSNNLAISRPNLWTNTNHLNCLAFENNQLFIGSESGQLIELNCDTLAFKSIDLESILYAYSQIILKNHNSLFILNNNGITILDSANDFKKIATIDVKFPGTNHISCDYCKIYENKLIYMANQCLTIYDLSNLENISTLGQQELSASAYLTAETDGEYFFGCGSTSLKGCTLEIWDLKDPKNIHCIYSNKIALCRAKTLCKMDNLLFIGTAYGEIQIYDLTDLKSPQLIQTLHTLPVSKPMVTCTKFISDCLFVGYENGMIDVFGMHQGKFKYLAFFQASSLAKISFIELCGSRLMAGTVAGHVAIWDF